MPGKRVRGSGRRGRRLSVKSKRLLVGEEENCLVEEQKVQVGEEGDCQVGDKRLR